MEAKDSWSSWESWTSRGGQFFILDKATGSGHLFLETPLDNLVELLRHFNITYTFRFNRRHERSGHLYQGRKFTKTYLNLSQNQTVNI